MFSTRNCYPGEVKTVPALKRELHGKACCLTSLTLDFFFFFLLPLRKPASKLNIWTPIVKKYGCIRFTRSLSGIKTTPLLPSPAMQT